MRKFLVSFTGLCEALSAQKVTQEDLNAALFFFACSRGYVIFEDPERLPVEIGCNFEDKAKGRQAFDMILAAIFKAEAEGRIAWRPGCKERTWSDLGEFLSRHGISGIRSDDSECISGDIPREIRKHGIDLDVIWAPGCHVF